MNNYKLIIQYDGTNYAGWQIQHNSVTIQQKIVNSIELILKEKVILNGSGRTDAGVHALGQTANFRTTTELDLYKFQYQLNSILPKDISIISADKTREDFHSRYDAKKRSYIYIISKKKSPFLNDFSWFLSRNIDVNKLNLISRLLSGKHDFSSFCRTQSDTENKVCEIYDIIWKEIKGMIIFYICADRFLHGMVRTIIGTLLAAENESNPAYFLTKIIEGKNRTIAGEAVPAQGLFLYKVKYDNKP